jgi:hypothetical protein
MEYKTCVTIHKKGKSITFFLKEGENLSYENIVDVEVHNQPERSKREDVTIYVCMEESSCSCEFPFHTVFETEDSSKAIKWLNEQQKKTRILQSYTRCGALNTMET